MKIGQQPTQKRASAPSHQSEALDRIPHAWGNAFRVQGLLGLGSCSIARTRLPHPALFSVFSGGRGPRCARRVQSGAPSPPPSPPPPVRGQHAFFGLWEPPPPNPTIYHSKIPRSIPKNRVSGITNPTRKGVADPTRRGLPIPPVGGCQSHPFGIANPAP